MAEPLTRSEPGDGPANPAAPSASALADAGLRLQRALDKLEAAMADGAPGPAVEAHADFTLELETSRWRERELQAAAAAASQTLERAMAEVRRALRTDVAAAGDGRLNSALESAPGSPEDPDGSSPEEEPAE